MSERAVALRRVAPLLVGTLGFGVLSDQWALMTLALAGLAGSVAITSRVEADRLAQLAMGLVAVVGAGFLVSRLYPEDAPLPMRVMAPGWVFFALVALFAAIPRLYLARPLGGHRLTAAFSLILVMACGGVEHQLVELYAGLVAVFLAVQLAVLIADDPAWSKAPRLPRLKLVTLVLATLAVTSGLATALPLLHAQAIRYFAGYSPSSSRRSGFDEQTRLGGMSHMLLSDEIVLRVFGPPPDYLRGVVYNRYFRGAWLSPPPTIGEPTATACEPPEGATAVRVVGGDKDRYFTPLDAAGIGVAGCSLTADASGIVRPAPPPTEAVWFTIGPRDAHPISAPTRADSMVPDEIRPALARLSNAWADVAGATTPRQTVDALANHLRNNYEYSLEFGNKGGVDPVVTFLQTERQGHCEYFASAMTLLARTRGIPARMVGGYRVTEHNPIGNYYIVRERNAHAWTEVWLDGRWHTVDATAAGDLPMTASTPWFSAAWDSAAAGLAATRDWVASRDPILTGTVIAALLAFWLFLRRRRQRTGAAAADGARYRDALPMLDRLIAALAKHGAVRPQSEPLERFAARVEPLDRQAAEALWQYAALRYGRLGASEQIVERLRTCAARLDAGGQSR